MPPSHPADDRYRPASSDPRELRSKRANQIAASALAVALLLVIAAIALFG